jgi:hypothetical protein
LEYFLWRSNRGEEFCVINDPEIDDIWQLSDGVPRQNAMDSPAPCRFDESFPKEIALADNLYGATVPVISRRTKEAIVAFIPTGIEYLPVRIINHKNRPESEEYFVLHPLHVVDCIDTDASGVEWNQISHDQISSCKSLVLKHESIPETCVLFRLAHWGENILVREDLAQALRGAGLTGLYFRPAAGYTGIG